MALKRSRCNECGSLYVFRGDALECCRPTVSCVYVCEECDYEHPIEEAAIVCCVKPQEETPENIAAELERRGQLRLIE